MTNDTGHYTFLFFVCEILRLYEEVHRSQEYLAFFLASKDFLIHQETTIVLCSPDKRNEDINYFNKTLTFI